jgi:hypothetical protein
VTLGTDDAVAGLVLEWLAHEVAAREVAGREDAGEHVARIATALESDRAAAGRLDAAARANAEPFGEAPEPPGARRDRLARREEVVRATGALVRAGRLAEDGPDRVALPGFGPATWRALAMLRAGATGPERSWALAVAAPGLTALGRPVAGDGPDPRLADHADRIHVLEGARQRLRHALLAADAAIGVARDLGNDPGAAARDAECAEREHDIARVDGMIVAAWREGGEAAIRYAAAA